VVYDSTLGALLYITPHGGKFEPTQIYFLAWIGNAWKQIIKKYAAYALFL
jgi:hypothetical protein